MRSRTLLAVLFGLTGGIDSALADAASDFTHVVFTEAVKKVVYPKIAKMKGQAGKVVVTATIGADGKVTAASVETSSGYSSLDDAAVKAVNDAAPFPAPPGGSITIHGVISFEP